MINAQDKPKSAILAFSWSDWMMLGFVLMLVGYFLPWFKLPAAGLTLIGIDISEWLKFLPQFDTGELPNRNWFYLPPICLGGMLILWSVLVDANGRRGWIMSGVGLLIALIAFPALEVLPINAEKFSKTGEWLFRFIGIGLVGLLALGRPLLSKLPNRLLVSLIAVTALIVAGLPAWLLYLSRSAYIFWLRLTPNPGVGFLLHMAAALLIFVGAILCWRSSQPNV